MSFVAQYRGSCTECGNDVLPGEVATYVGHHAQGEIRHVKCPGEPTKPGEICPRCFMELPVSGACGVCDS